MDKKRILFWAELAIIVFLFIVSSYFAQTKTEFITGLIKNNLIGILIYLLITVIAVVVAPITIFPILPMAANVFGWFQSAVITIFGWTIGAVIAFFIARKYGVPLVQKVIPVKRLWKYEEKVKNKDKFLGIVVMRMLIPVDILSYALGLFSKVSYKTYTIATFIGVIPFTLLYSYAGTVNLLIQVIIILIFLIIIILWLIYENLKFKFLP